MSGSQQQVQVTQAVRDALARGELIAAIKALHDANPHVGLRDLKTMAERFQRDGLDASAVDATDARPASDDGTWPAAVDAAIARGDLLEAIKRLRDARGISLRDAKAAVELRVAQRGPGAGASSGGPRRPSGVASTPTIAPGDAGGSKLRWLVPALMVLVVLVAAALWWSQGAA